MVKVLIIEDESDLRDVYEDQFSREGFEVGVAVDGQDGVGKLQSFRPDVVLLDLMMPKLTGFDVLKFIKEAPEFKGLPVIVLTNIFADAQDLVQNWGATDVLLKVDQTPGQLVEKTKKVLVNKATLPL